MKRRAACLLILIASTASADLSSYAEYRKGILASAPGTTRVEEVQFRVGSPYWKRITKVGGKVKEEWRYPTAIRESGMLLFEDGVLTTSKFIEMAGDNFIRDDSPIMNRKGEALRNKLRRVSVGTPSVELAGIRRPIVITPEAEMNELLAFAKDHATKAGIGSFMERDRVDGDTWIYECGDLTFSFIVKDGRVIEIVELLMPSRKQLEALIRESNRKNF